MSANLQPRTNREELYKKEIAAMTDEKFFDECKQRVWLAAYAHNNPRSDYHWQVDACYDESDNREGDIYSRAHKEVSREL